MAHHGGRGWRYLVITAATALSFGALGGVAGSWAMRDQLTGPEGPPGPPGSQGPAGPIGPEGELQLSGFGSSADLSTILANLARRQDDLDDRVDLIDGSSPLQQCDTANVLTSPTAVVDLTDPVASLLFTEKICVTHP